MRSRRRGLLAVLAVTSALAVSLALPLAGCGSARRGEPLTGVVAAPLIALDTGRLVFMQECHRCHPGGEAGLGPSLNDKPLPGFLMKFQVRHGLGVMPGFDEERISDEQLDQLIGYLQALRDRPLLADSKRPAG
jgi:mono/diheme cytochrome c family protein